jgi:hypothetical protein
LPPSARRESAAPPADLGRDLGRAVPLEPNRHLGNIDRAPKRKGQI